MEKQATIPSPAPHRRLRVILIAFTAAMLLLFVVVAVLCTDTAPPEDSDLQPVFADVPDDQNALLLFEEAGDQIDQNIKEADPEHEGTSWRDMLRYEERWDDEKVAAALRDNAEAIRLIERALSCPVPGPLMPGAKDDIHPSFVTVRPFLELEGKALCRKGRFAEGYACYMKGVRFGYQLGPTIVMGDAGSLTKLVHVDRMTKYLPSTSFDEETTASFIRNLDADRFTGEQFGQALKLFYARYAGIADLMKNTESEMGEAILQTALELQYVPMSPYHCQPNRTKRELADIVRKALKQWPADCTALPKRDNPFTGPPISREGISTTDKIRQFLTRNSFGDALLQGAGRDLSETFWWRQEENMRITALQTLLALKCHKSETGSLPQSLDELVPAHLPAIRADDFDGKPLRYSPEKKLLYSVGEDLVDDGGDGRKDIIFKIEF